MDKPELHFASATSLAFAGVLSLAAIVTRLTAALPFTGVLAFAPVLTLIGISHGLQRDTGVRTGARGVGANRKGTCQEAGDCRTCDHCFGWSNHLSTLSIFLWLGVWSPSLQHCCSKKTANIPSSSCARVGILVDAGPALLFPKFIPIVLGKQNESANRRVGVSACRRIGRRQSVSAYGMQKGLAPCTILFS
jgi:hypothetical protein